MRTTEKVMPAASRTSAHGYTLEMQGHAVGGFADVAGLDSRAGAGRGWIEPLVAVLRKLLGLRKHPSLSLKRGYIESNELWGWLQASRAGTTHSASRDLDVVRHDERGIAIGRWHVRNARCSNLVGPSLDPKAGSVAIERLDLTCDAVGAV